MSSNKKIAINGVMWTTVSTVVRSLVALFQISILTHFVQKSDFGIVAIATLFTGFTSLFTDLGVSSGLLHKQEVSSNEYSSLFWLNIMTGSLLTVILIVVAPIISEIYNITELTRVLSLLSLTIFLSSLGIQHKIIQQKKCRFRIISLVEIISSVTTLVIASFLAFKGAGIYSLVVSTLWNSFVSNFSFLLLGLKQDKYIKFHFKFNETKDCLKIGSFSLGSHIFDYFSKEIDVILISTSLGQETLGLYSVCKKLVMMVYGAINPIINKVLTPLLSNIQNNKNHVKKVYYKVVESLSLFNFPIYAIISIFSGFFIKLLYGNSYLDGTGVLSMLAINYGLLSVGSPVGALQVALGRTDTGFYWTICRIIFSTIAVLIGVKYNIVVVVVCLIIMNVFTEPLSWRITLKPLIGGSFIEYYSIILKVAILVISMSIPCFFLSKLDDGVVHFLVCVVSFIIIFIYIVSRLYRTSYIFEVFKDYAKKYIM